MNIMLLPKSKPNFFTKIPVDLCQILAKKSEFVLLVNPLSMAQAIQSFWVGQVECAATLSQEDTLSPITIWGCGQRQVGISNNVGTRKSPIVSQENPMVE